ncbi:phytanoyl-CoA dioxygenase family protein [Maricaulaceae bacterium MS644]
MSQTSKREDSARYDVSGEWGEDNQAWWDWYVSLAHNPDEARERIPATLSGAAPASDEALATELAEPYPIQPEQIKAFRRDGSVKLPEMISPNAAARLRLVMAQRLGEAFSTTLDGGADGRFLSLEMVWLTDTVLRAFTLSPRIAGVCAALLGVPAVRLYHDNVLSKEPGCGRTPWHFDAHHFPLATNDVVTAWIPAQAIRREMGPLAFASPIDAWRLVENIRFDKTDDSYDRRVAETFREHGTQVDDSGFDEGTVSFHHNLSFHTAGGNFTTLSRLVLANTYFADGARVVDAPTLVSGDWRKFIPDTEPGEIAASALNPICWPNPTER